MSLYSSTFSPLAHNATAPDLSVAHFIANTIACHFSYSSWSELERR